MKNKNVKNKLLGVPRNKSPKNMKKQIFLSLLVLSVLLSGYSQDSCRCNFIDMGTGDYACFFFDPRILKNFHSLPYIDTWKIEQIKRPIIKEIAIKKYKIRNLKDYNYVFSSSTNSFIPKSKNKNKIIQSYLHGPGEPIPIDSISTFDFIREQTWKNLLITNIQVPGYYTYKEICIRTPCKGDNYTVKYIDTFLYHPGEYTVKNYKSPSDLILIFDKNHYNFDFNVARMYYYLEPFLSFENPESYIPFFVLLTDTYFGTEGNTFQYIKQKKNRLYFTFFSSKMQKEIELTFEKSKDPKLKFKEKK